MATINILLVTVLCALALACIVGVVVGKYQAKKAAGQLRGLLSPRERAIYVASVVLGVVLLLVGIFYQGPAQRPDEWDFMASDPYFEGGHYEGDYSGSEVIVHARPVPGGAVRIG